jgi:DNA-binding SARP family transcriptional activator
MASSRLVLTVLGGFQARRDRGGACPIPSRKGQALLAYLGLSAGRAFPRDLVWALLWPDSPSEQARGSLRHVLAVIRQALGTSTSRCLITDADTVGLDAQWVDVDVTTFERSIAHGTLPDLEAAVALYGGDLLAGLRVNEPPFEDWLRHERERLRELAVKACARLLNAFHHSAIEAAIQAGLRLLALDPVQEPVHRALMEMYVQLREARNSKRAFAVANPSPPAPAAHHDRAPGGRSQAPPGGRARGDDLRRRSAGRRAGENSALVEKTPGTARARSKPGGRRIARSGSVGPREC